MTASLNQQPLTCGPGSKTSSCQFSLNAQAGTTQTLEMNIVRSHAQHADFEFIAL